MATGELPVAHAPLRARRRLPTLGLRWRRVAYHPVARGLAFLALGLGMLVMGLLRASTVPPSSYAPVVLVAALYLQPYWMALVAGTFALELVMLTAVTSLLRGASISSWVALVANLLVIGLAWGASAARARVGVQGHRGESMFVDLRDRLRALGELPTLPAGWHAEAAVESAVRRSPSPATSSSRRRSGRGRSSRSSSSTSPARASRPAPGPCCCPAPSVGCSARPSPQRFLGAANAYLLRQEWDEGFATAVHVSLDLRTGEYNVGTCRPPRGRPAPSPAPARWAVLAGHERPASSGSIEGAAFRGSRRATRPRRRARALHRRGRRVARAATSARASTGCSAPPSGSSPPASRAGRGV